LNHVKEGWHYLLASKRNGTLYRGVKSDLPRRVWQHGEGHFEGFSNKYGCKLLVWFERYPNLHDARVREAQIKEWAWKLELIEKDNPVWRDL